MRRKVAFTVAAATAAAATRKEGMENCGRHGRTAEVLALKHNSRIGFSDSGPILDLAHGSHGRAKPVINGPNSTESNLFHHGETTYRVG